MNRSWKWRAFKIALLGAAALALFGFLVMSLWNWLAPAVFGGRTITIWQALGILILSKILFGGFHGGHGGSGHWKRRMRARWERMTPEEREKFRHTMAARCGGKEMEEGPARAANAE